MSDGQEPAPSTGHGHDVTALVAAIEKSLHEKHKEKLTTRLRDKIETALINLAIWGTAIVVGWAISFVYVGKAQITDVHNDSVKRDADIKADVEKRDTELHDELNEIKTAIGKLTETLKNHPPKIILPDPDLQPSPTSGNSTLPPPQPGPPESPQFEQRVQQQALDYYETHSKKYAE